MRAHSFIVLTLFGVGRLGVMDVGLGAGCRRAPSSPGRGLLCLEKRERSTHQPGRRLGCLHRQDPRPRERPTRDAAVDGLDLRRRGAPHDDQGQLGVAAQVAPGREGPGVLVRSRSDETQVFTLDRRGGEGVQLTHVEQGVEAYEWSPDGKRLVLLIRDPKPSQGKVPGPWVIDRLTFKADYVGYLDRRRGHLYIYDIDSKSVMQITAGDYEDYSPAWSPDGSRIAFVSNRTEEPDANSNSDIWLVDPGTPYDRQEPVRVTTNPGSDGSPIWHPDGERIGYLTTYHGPDRRTQRLPADKSRDHSYRRRRARASHHGGSRSQGLRSRFFSGRESHLRHARG